MITKIALTLITHRLNAEFSRSRDFRGQIVGPSGSIQCQRNNYTGSQKICHVDFGVMKPNPKSEFDHRPQGRNIPI